MKRPVLLLLILVLLGGAIYFFTLYKQSKNEPYGTFIVPRLEYSAFVFKQIKPEYVTMDMKMLIDNPSPIGFKVDSFTYDFYIADFRVFSSTYPEEIDFNNLDSSYIMIPITMWNDTLTYVLDSLKKAGVENTTYSVKGHFYADIPVLKERKFKYNQSFEAPLYKIPATKLIDWDYDGLEKGDATINFTLRIVNFNVFPYEFKDIEYRVELGDNNRVFEGKKMGQIDIPKEDSVDLVLPVVVDLDELGGAFLEYIGKGDQLTYDFYSKLILTSKSNTIKDSPMELFSTGNLETIKEFINGSQ
jgi:LEA14-like dessication related protein